jgi:hypothetical protein
MQFQVHCSKILLIRSGRVAEEGTQALNVFFKRDM